MKKTARIFAFVLLAMFAAMAASAGGVLTFKTNVYNIQGTGNAFHFVVGADVADAYIDVDCGFGPTEYPVDISTIDPDTNELTGTTVSCTVSEAGTVTITGDVDKITYFNAEGCYIESIDFTACPDLQILNLSYNELKALDLTPNTKLAAIYVSGNTFSEETPLVIGKNKADLSILEMQVVEWIDQSFSPSDYPALRSFDAWACHTLRKCDTSGCPLLIRLSVDSCPVSSLDLSNNEALMILNVSESAITSLDLSHNPYLTQLYAVHESGTLNTDKKISSIDLSANYSLQFLFMAGNHLTEIDLSKNIALKEVGLKNNYLSKLDISKNPGIYNLDIALNYFDFATLPLDNGNFNDYVYNQRAIPMDRSYAVGTVLDFSDKVLREGTNTDAVLYSLNSVTNEAQKLDASFYTFADGKFTFNKVPSDSVFVRFANAAFPYADLHTSNFKVKSEADFGKPTAVIDFSCSRYSGDGISFSVGMDGATEATPKKFMVDLGDGNPVEFTATTDLLPLQANVDAVRNGNNKVTIYAPEGEVVTAFGIDGVEIYDINVTKATELRELRVSDAALYDIDLRRNRCLRMLDLSGNNFTKIDLQGVSFGYSKNALSDIDLSHNRISELTLNAHSAIRNLDLSHNELSDYQLKDFDYIKTLDISYNKFTSVNLSYMAEATDINVSNNLIEEITMPETNSLEHFDVSGNRLGIAGVPYLDFAGYVYAPQSVISIPTKAPGIDLTKQNRIIDGQGTVYTWYLADGTPVADGDISVTDGVSRFNRTDLGNVYCGMTHPMLPEFSGDNQLRTTEVETAGMPTNVLGSFTTPVGGESVSLSLAATVEAAAIFIDWRGDGSSLEQYTLGNTYTNFNATTVAGANVKVYSYEAPGNLGVFSITGATMANLDLSGMKQLIHLTVSNAGLTDITLPPSPSLFELFLDNNNFSEFDFSKIEGVSDFGISGNRLTEADLSSVTTLCNLALSNNKLTSFSAGNNPALNTVLLSHNEIENVDLSGAPGLEQLTLDHNKLSHLDISKTPRLRVLYVNNNLFDFSTLPRPRSGLNVYHYGNQQALHIEEVNHQVDLSTQAEVDGTPTVYTWFIGVPEFDEEGNLSGESLIEGTEYTIEGGVTTFLRSNPEVMCVMTNPLLPELYLYTNTIDATAGVENIGAGVSGELTVRVENGNVVVTAPSAADVRLYDAAGRLSGASTVTDGRAVFSRIEPGLYIVAAGTKAVKVAVK